MKRLGESQIPLALEAPGAREHDGKAAHEEAGAVRTPDVGVRVSRGGKIEQPVFKVPAKSPGQVFSPRRGRRYRDERVTGAVRQGSERAQAARGLALQPRERLLRQAGSLGPA